MEKTPCFCGSGKPHTECHGHIGSSSFVAHLYLLQRQLDEEIARQRRENNLPFKCRAGCSDCCSRCFNVSEPEFIQILDVMFTSWEPGAITQLIRRAHEQWQRLVSDYPETARKISGRILLEDLMRSHETILPFPCVFLNDDGRCSVYDVRPLVCRVYGVGLTARMRNSRPCSHLLPMRSARDHYADLSAFDNSLGRFDFFEYNGQVIFRRPVPLFYYFKLLFDNPETPGDIRLTPFYQSLLELDEDAYIASLVKEPDITNS